MSRFCYWPMKEIQKSYIVASLKLCPGNWSCGNITVTMKNNNTFYWSEKVFIWPSTKTFIGSLWQNFNIRGFKRLDYLLKLANLMQQLRIYIECTLFLNIFSLMQLPAGKTLWYISTQPFSYEHHYQIIMQVPWLNRKMCSIYKMF